MGHRPNVEGDQAKKHLPLEEAVCIPMVDHPSMLDLKEEVLERPKTSDYFADYVLSIGHPLQ